MTSTTEAAADLARVRERMAAVAARMAALVNDRELRGRARAHA